MGVPPGTGKESLSIRTFIGRRNHLVSKTNQRLQVEIRALGCEASDQTGEISTVGDHGGDAEPALHGSWTGCEKRHPGTERSQIIGKTFIALKLQALQLRHIQGLLQCPAT